MDRHEAQPQSLKTRQLADGKLNVLAHRRRGRRNGPLRASGSVASQLASRSRPGGYLIIQGDTVRFHTRDIFLPGREDLPKALTTTRELEGIVTGFSDSGLQPRVFAVVDVIARQSVVVPVEKLLIARFAEGQSN